MVCEVYSSGRLPKLTVLSVGCAEEPEDTRSGPIMRNAFVIHYCISGHGYYLGNKVCAGEGFVFLPGSTVEYHPSNSDPWKYLWFILETDDPDYFLKYYDVDEKTGIFSYDFVDVIDEYYRNLRRAVSFSVNPIENSLIYFNVLRSHTSSKSEGSKAKLYAMSAKDYIETNYHLHPSIGDLAQYLNISQSYLYRVFTDEFGVSPKEYLNRFCMEQAKLLLRTSNLNISQVAASVGYNDVLAFSAFFSKRKGCSPTAYRNKKRNQ